MLTSKRFSRRDREALGYNPNRDDDLFALTADGYIIAQDIACQHEYIYAQACPHCGAASSLTPIASINRSFQGLNEMVARCTHCNRPAGFIFDISNTRYQEWLAERMGDLYAPVYDGPPRVPAA